jgi:hypothetical protein
VAHINLRGENLVDSERAIKLDLEIAYSRTKSVYFGDEAGVVSNADVAEQGFRHLRVLHNERQARELEARRKAHGAGSIPMSTIARAAFSVKTLRPAGIPAFPRSGHSLAGAAYRLPAMVI